MKEFKSIYPFDQSVIETYSIMDKNTVAKILTNSTKAFNSFKKTSFEYRAALFINLAKNLRKNKAELALLITYEMGKVLAEANSEIEKCALQCEYFAENTEQLLKEEVIKSEFHKSSIFFEPIGAIFAIMPWNFPFWQVFRYAAKTLMAGNVTLLKHAPNVTGCALAIEKLFLESGFPEGVFHTLIIDIDQVESVIADNIVQGVTFTGSEMAGSKVGALAGKHIKKSVLELGGSDAFIVLADADLEKAAKSATISRMINAGQACNSAKRFIVENKVVDEFTALFLTHVKNLKQGNPLLSDTTIGPLARPDLAENLEKQVSESVKMGAKLLLENQNKECNFSPNILINIDETMPAFKEELFGPVATISKVDSYEMAIKLTNNHRYGLDTSIWTKDIELASKMARNLESGSVFINTLVKSDPRFPFGGIKKSGYGRELSAYGIKEFVNIKTVLIDE